jgi:hypothetical protein
MKRHLLVVAIALAAPIVLAAPPAAAAPSEAVPSGVVPSEAVPSEAVPLGKLPAEPFVKQAPRPSGYRCDGTDPFFFEELERAGDVGYGETWDETLCDEGVAIYAEGATSRWKAFRTPRRPPRPSDEEQMLALVMPMFAVGGLGALFLAAAALAAASRLRKRVVLEVPCPSCEAPLPIPVDDTAAHQLFCPLCGAACAVDVEGRGARATARARLLA